MHAKTVRKFKPDLCVEKNTFLNCQNAFDIIMQKAILIIHPTYRQTYMYTLYRSSRTDGISEFAGKLGFAYIWRTSTKILSLIPRRTEPRIVWCIKLKLRIDSQTQKKSRKSFNHTHEGRLPKFVVCRWGGGGSHWSGLGQLVLVLDILLQPGGRTRIRTTFHNYSVFRSSLL